MVDELDYHVTFPTKFSQSEKTSGKDSDLRQRDEVKLVLPVVFLLGWYGCQDKYLAKYSAIYEAKGYITIRYILPPNYLFSTKARLVRDVAYKVLQTFFELGLEKSPIFFHVFSNGGGFVYKNISDIVTGPDPEHFATLQIAGVILDSLPSKPNAMTAYRAMVSAMPRSQHWIITSIKSLLMWIIFMILNLLPAKASMGFHRSTYYQAMLDDRIPCPQLFLYSKADKTIPYLHVQAVIAARQQGGFDTRQVLWEDSDHVAHLRTHPEEYAAACLEFVSYCVDMIDREMD